MEGLCSSSAGADSSSELDWGNIMMAVGEELFEGILDWGNGEREMVMVLQLLLLLLLVVVVVCAEGEREKVEGVGEAEISEEGE